MNLLTKNNFFLILFFFSLISSISFYTLDNIKKDLNKNIQGSLNTVLLSVQNAHYTLINQRMLTSQSFASSPWLIALTEKLLILHSKNISLKTSNELKELRVRIKPELQRFGDQGFFIIAPDKISIASMRNENLSQINLIHTHKSKLLNRAFSGESVFIPTIRSDIPLQGQFSKSVTMFVIVPIRNLNDEIIAVFSLRMEPKKHFSDIAKIGRIGESGETYAFDAEGIFLTKSRFEHQLIQTNQLKTGQHEELNLRIADPGGDLLAGYRPTLPAAKFPLTKMAKNATSGINGFNMEGYRDYRGVNVLGVWLWDERLSIGLATEIDRDEALLPYYRTRYAFLVGITLIIVFAILILRLIINIQKDSNSRILKAHTSLESKVIERTKELTNAKEDLSNAFKELELLAITDSLTGLANRRHFDNQMNIEWQRGIREGKSISVVFFDIDYFKQFNDSYGHIIGDNCLKKISTMLLESTIAKRLGDLACRYGGEEFIILLPASDLNYAKIVAQNIKQHIEMLCIPHNKTLLKETCYVTVSVGYACEGDLKNNNTSSLIQKADEALYMAKELGRNNICQYQEKAKAVTNNIHNIKNS